MVIVGMPDVALAGSKDEVEDVLWTSTNTVRSTVHCQVESVEEHDTLHTYHSTCQFSQGGYHFTSPNDNKKNNCKQEPQNTTDQRDAHLLVGVSETPSPMKIFNLTTSTSGGGALAVNSPSGLVMVNDSEPSGSSEPLSTRKRYQKGNYVFVGTSEEANWGRDQNPEEKGDTQGVSAVSKPSGVDMAGTPDVLSPRDACPPEVKDDAHSGLLARVRGSLLRER
eukprot:6194534-Pleurochrysis_carterae.AAC.4